MTLIVTLSLDAASAAFFDALRTAYFPPQRLVVGAHVTMFHAIPDALEAVLSRHVAAECAAMQPFALSVRRLRFLGRGAAYDLASAEAVSLRARLAAGVAHHLTAQDRAPWSPHVTVQNKVTPEVARATLETLRGVEVKVPLTATGIAIWTYLGGPWAALAAHAFGGQG